MSGGKLNKTKSLFSVKFILLLSVLIRNSASFQCYSCGMFSPNIPCENPDKMTCPEDWKSYKCLTMLNATQQSIVVGAKMCTNAENDAFRDSCHDKEGKVNPWCIYCDTNLCNDQPIKLKPLGVIGCYVCKNEECDNPQKTQCAAADRIAYDCITSKIIADHDIGMITRNCHKKADKNGCLRVSALGGYCNICESDYCNDFEAREPKDTVSSLECYQCTELILPCENPMTEKCKKDGKSYKCITVFDPDAGTAIRKACVDPDPEHNTYHDVCEEYQKVKEDACTYCDTNLCNNQNYSKMKPPNKMKPLGVAQCYRCTNPACDNPQKLPCDKPDKTAYSCISAGIKTGGRTTKKMKECVKKSQVDKCNDFKVPGGYCNICDSDNCNNFEAHEEQRVKKAESKATRFTILHVFYLALYGFLVQMALQ